MPKKMLILLTFVLALAGCGSSAPEMQHTSPAGCAAEDSENCIEITAPNSAADTQPIENDSHFTPAETAPPKETVLTGSYFQFSRESTVATAADGTEILYEYRCDTDYTGMDPETDQWVDSILESIRQEYASNSSNLLQYAQDSLELSGKDYFYGFSNYQEIGVGRHDQKVVSIIVRSSIYSGGAHPNTIQTTWNLDMKNRTVLKLEDILCDGGVAIAEKVQQQIEERFEGLAQDALFSDYKWTISHAFVAEMMTPYWYFNDKGLVIFFNQYELGPYATGIINTLIPYEELHGLIKEEYFPDHYAQIPGDVLLRGEWEGYRQIPVTVETDGEQIWIGIEGEVFQFQLSEVSWLEGTAIGQKMLFSADHLEQNDVVVLTGGFDDENRSFAIEFCDGTGNTVIYYVHPNGLSTEP